MDATGAETAERAKTAAGRWPANLVLSHTPECAVEAWECAPDCPARLLDEQSGKLGRGRWPAARGHGGLSTVGHSGQTGLLQRDANLGGASRFFYCAKASRRERNCNGSDNRHPTVKSLALMRWLCRLITPPGGIVLDPFAGSGSTLIAACGEGFHAIGIEQDLVSILTAWRRIGQRAQLVVRRIRKVCRTVIEGVVADPWRPVAPAYQGAVWCLDVDTLRTTVRRPARYIRRILTWPGPDGRLDVVRRLAPGNHVTTYRVGP